MTREIKFRAWDGKNMIDDFLVWSDGRSCEHLGDNEINYPMNWNLMQFTGLKDKNGKEIYEGDVIRNSYTWPGQMAVVWNESHVGFILKKGVLMVAFEIGTNHEIIGNVYENPELQNFTNQTPT